MDDGFFCFVLFCFVFRLRTIVLRMVAFCVHFYAEEISYASTLRFLDLGGARIHLVRK
jgi:hypothetical protein